MSCRMLSRVLQHSGKDVVLQHNSISSGYLCRQVEVRDLENALNDVRVGSVPEKQLTFRLDVPKDYQLSVPSIRFEYQWSVVVNGAPAFDLTLQTQSVKGEGVAYNDCVYFPVGPGLISPGLTSMQVFVDDQDLSVEAFHFSKDKGIRPPQPLLNWLHQFFEQRSGCFWDDSADSMINQLSPNDGAPKAPQYVQKSTDVRTNTEWPMLFGLSPDNAVSFDYGNLSERAMLLPPACPLTLRLNLNSVGTKLALAPNNKITMDGTDRTMRFQLSNLTLKYDCIRTVAPSQSADAVLNSRPAAGPSAFGTIDHVQADGNISSKVVARYPQSDHIIRTYQLPAPVANRTSDMTVNFHMGQKDTLPYAVALFVASPGCFSCTTDEGLFGTNNSGAKFARPAINSVNFGNFTREPREQSLSYQIFNGQYDPHNTTEKDKMVRMALGTLASNEFVDPKRRTYFEQLLFRQGQWGDNDRAAFVQHEAGLQLPWDDVVFLWTQHSPALQPHRLFNKWEQGTGELTVSLDGTHYQNGDVLFVIGFYPAQTCIGVREHNCLLTDPKYFVSGSFTGLAYTIPEDS